MTNISIYLAVTPLCYTVTEGHGGDVMCNRSTCVCVCLQRGQLCVSDVFMSFSIHGGNPVIFI